MGYQPVEVGLSTDELWRPQLNEHRSCVGLDVHARTVEGCVIDAGTDEIIHRKLVANTPEIVAWVSGLPSPQVVTYEAGPTGFGLFRQLVAAGIDCQVAAPSKLQRPVGDRIKTDARDAEHLAKLLRLGQIVEVIVPSAEAEAVRDVVRAREDTRQVLMGNRHQLSKLLLRHGYVYDGGAAWTGNHDRWLREHRTSGDRSFGYRWGRRPSPDSALCQPLLTTRKSG